MPIKNKKENKINKDLELKKNGAQKLSDEDVENASGGLGIIASVLVGAAVKEGVKLGAREIKKRR